jgi:MFS family permease
MRARDWVIALSERNFRLFFVGQATSQLGSGMAPVAITFAVLEHGTANDVGYVAAAGLVPVVLFLLVGGVIADRLSRRVVMLTSDIIRTIAEIGLGIWILCQTPPLWGFIAVAAVMGGASAFFIPAMSGLMPQVVTKGNLLQANALNGLSSSTAQIVGPALAGIIVAVSNPGWAVLVDGLTYAVSVASLLYISIEWTARPSTETFLFQLRRGWSEFWSRTWLWVIVVVFSCINIFESAPLFVLGPTIAKSSLGGATAWGSILAAGAAGAVVGGIVMLRVNPKRPLFVAMTASFNWALPLLALAYSTSVPLIAAGFFAAGIGSAVFGSLWSTTLQREIPSEVLSRVVAYDMFGSLAFLPLGMALVGPIALAVGTQKTIVGAAVLLVVFILVTLAVPSVRHVRAPSELREDDARLLDARSVSDA